MTNSDDLPLPNIRNIFKERFINFDILLPDLDVINRTSGTIMKRTWMIKYRFGKEGEREYCEYYANTRFVSGDEHVKIYEDGEQVDLPSLSSGYCYKPGKEEEARIEYEKEYQKIFQELTGEGGILEDGPYSGSFVINSACSLGVDKDKEEKGGF